MLGQKSFALRLGGAVQMLKSADQDIFRVSQIFRGKFQSQVFIWSEWVELPLLMASLKQVCLKNYITQNWRCNVVDWCNLVNVPQTFELKCRNKSPF